MIAKLSGHTQIMRDEQHAQAQTCLNFSQQRENLCLHTDIECANSLIGHQHFRLTSQGARNGQALSLPTTELRGVSAERLHRQSNLLHQGFRKLTRFVFRHAKVNGPFHNGLAHSAPRIQ